MIRANSSGEFFLRAMLLIAVFAVVAVAFWYQTENSFKEIRARGTVYDQTETLTAPQKSALREYAAALREKHGLKLRVQVRNTPVELPASLDSNTVFIGINPYTKQVLVEFPPLLRKALGEEYMYSLQNTYFTPYFEKNQWQAGLASALQKLWDDISK
ncbi:MAG: TPM domain-containing protein [Desulfovibrionales bacterium]|nr:TPM domain-containing protein [Desulfovibrionales bacterium]